MSFDLKTAVEVNNEAVSTVPFDITTAQEIPQVPEPKSEPGILSRIGRFFLKDKPYEKILTGNYLLEKMADGTIENIKRKPGESLEDFDKRYSVWDANTQKLLIDRESEIKNQGLMRVFEGPITLGMAVQSVAHPVGLAAGLAGFTALDTVFNSRQFVEKKLPNTPGTVKDYVELFDLFAKGLILGGVGVGIKNRNQLKVNIKNAFSRINFPTIFKIQPKTARQLDAIGAAEAMGVEDAHISAAENSNLPITVDSTKLVDVVKEGNWDQSKKILLEDETEALKAHIDKQRAELSKQGYSPQEIVEIMTGNPGEQRLVAKATPNPVAAAAETPLKKKLRLGDVDEVGTNLENIKFEDLEKEPELKALIKDAQGYAEKVKEVQPLVNSDVEAVSKAMNLNARQHAQEKSLKSIVSKILRKTQERPYYSFDDMTDYGRGTIVVNDFNTQIPEALNLLVDKGWAPSPNFGGDAFGGFKILSLTKKQPNGIQTEMQLSTPEIWKLKKDYSDVIYHEIRDLIDRRVLTPEEKAKFIRLDDESRAKWAPVYAALDVEGASRAAISAGVKRTASSRSTNIEPGMSRDIKAPEESKTPPGSLKSTILPEGNLKTESDIVSRSKKSVAQEWENVKPEMIEPRATGITLLQEKLDKLELAQDKADLARETLVEINRLRHEFRNGIRRYEGGMLAEEYQEIPRFYRSKNVSAMSPDEAMQKLRDDYGMEIANESELASYLKNLDATRKNLLSEIDKGPGKISMGEITFVRKQLKAATGGFKEGVAATKEEISAVQTRLIDAIEGAGIPSEYKGRFLRAIKNIQTEKDLAKVVDDFAARIDTLAEKVERENLVEGINKVKTENIAVEYKQAIEKIKGQFDFKSRSEKTLAKREKMREFVERMQKEGKEVPIPDEILNMLDKKTLGEIPLEELRQIRSQVEHLGRLGKTKIAAREAVYQYKKENIKQKLLPQIQAINSKKVAKVPIGSTPNKWAERYAGLMNHIIKTKTGLTAIEGLADVTGMHDVKVALDKPFGEYLVYNDPHFIAWEKLTRGFTQGNLDRIGAYAAKMQEGGPERLENSGQLKEAEAIQLTPEEMKAYEFVRKIFDQHHPKVSDIVKELYNEDVGKVSNYVSFMSDYEQMSDLEMYDRFGNRPQEAVDRRTKNVERGFTKERTALSPIKLELNIDKIFRRHMDDVAYLLHMAKPIKMYSEIVNSPEISGALGDVGALAWKQWFDLLARKGGQDGGKRIAAIDIVRRNMGAGVLGFRLSSALVQFSSFGDTMATIGAEWATRGAKNIATSREWRNFIMDNFPEVKKAVGDDVAFREFGENFLGKAARVGMQPLQFLDGLMRSTAASGAYEKIARERGIPVDLKNPNPDIIAEATKTMRQSQGSSFFKDQPLSITTGYGLAENRSVNKMLLTFQSFMLNRWDNINRQIWRLGIKEKDYGKAAAATLWLTTLGFALEEVLRRGGRAITQVGQKKKRKEAPFAQDVAMNAVQSVPLLGQIASSIAYSSNPVPVINAFQDAIEGTGAVVKGKKIKTKISGAVRAAGGAGSMLGIPGSSQMSQFIRQRMKE